MISFFAWVVCHFSCQCFCCHLSCCHLYLMYSSSFKLCLGKNSSSMQWYTLLKMKPNRVAVLCTASANLFLILIGAHEDEPCLPGLAEALRGVEAGLAPRTSSWKERLGASGLTLTLYYAHARVSAAAPRHPRRVSAAAPPCAVCM